MPKEAPLAINLVKLERQVVPRARSQEEPRPATFSGQQRSVVKAILLDSSRAERRPEGEDPPGTEVRRTRSVRWTTRALGASPA